MANDGKAIVKTKPGPGLTLQGRLEQALARALLNLEFLGILRITVIIVHLGILFLLVFGHVYSFDYPDFTCALPICSAMFELIQFFRVYWKIVIFDDKMIELEVLVHIPLGIISILLSIAYLINLDLPAPYHYHLRQNLEVDDTVNTLALDIIGIAWACTFGLGVLYIIRSLFGWYRLKVRAKEEKNKGHGHGGGGHV